MSPAAADYCNDDDLYCDPSSEPLPESVHHDDTPAAEGATTKANPPLQKTRTRSRHDSSGSVVVDSRFTWVNTHATPQEAPPSPPSFRRSDEWDAIDKEFTLYEAQLLDNEREGLEEEITWREGEFERLKEMSEKEVPVRFARPMDMGHVKLLVDYPELLLRYFQNEKRIAQAIERCEVKFRRMHRANADSSRNYYAEELKIRRDIYAMCRLKLEPITKKLLTHIMSRLCALVGVQLPNFLNNKPLCVLEDAFIQEVILKNAMLRMEWEECWKLETTILKTHIACIKHIGES